MENKYYESGDSTILVLKILESENGKLFICLNYSYNHQNYGVIIMNEEDFNEFYLSNEIFDYEFDDNSYKGLL